MSEFLRPLKYIGKVNGGGIEVGSPITVPPPHLSLKLKIASNRRILGRSFLH